MRQATQRADKLFVINALLSPGDLNRLLVGLLRLLKFPQVSVCCRQIIEHNQTRRGGSGADAIDGQCLLEIWLGQMVDAARYKKTPEFVEFFRDTWMRLAEQADPELPCALIIARGLFIITLRKETGPCCGGGHGNELPCLRVLLPYIDCTLVQSNRFTESTLMMVHVGKVVQARCQLAHRSAGNRLPDSDRLV
jgi:hypothetical protein